MWFASLFNNEALISISTVQLLQFFWILLAQAQAPARTVWKEESGQPKKPIPASPRQALPKPGTGGSDGSAVRALEAVLAPCSKWLLPRG